MNTRRAALGIGGMLFISGLVFAPAANASPAPAAQRPALVAAVPAVKPVVPANTKDYRQGFRDGYRDGWSQARDDCDPKWKWGGGGQKHHAPKADYARGYDDGFLRGYDRGFGEYCGKAHR